MIRVTPKLRRELLDKLRSAVVIIEKCTTTNPPTPGPCPKEDGDKPKTREQIHKDDNEARHATAKATLEAMPSFAKKVITNKKIDGYTFRLAGKKGKDEKNAFVKKMLAAGYKKDKRLSTKLTKDGAGKEVYVHSDGHRIRITSSAKTSKIDVVTAKVQPFPKEPKPKKKPKLKTRNG